MDRNILLGLALLGVIIAGAVSDPAQPVFANPRRRKAIEVDEDDVEVDEEEDSEDEDSEDEEVEEDEDEEFESNPRTAKRSKKSGLPPKSVVYRAIERALGEPLDERSKVDVKRNVARGDLRITGQLYIDLTNAEQMLDDDRELRKYSGYFDDNGYYVWEMD